MWFSLYAVFAVLVAGSMASRVVINGACEGCARIDATKPNPSYGNPSSWGATAPPQTGYQAANQGPYYYNQGRAPFQPQYPAPNQGRYPAPTQGPYAAPNQGQYAAPSQAQYPAPNQGQYPAPNQGQYPAPSQGQYPAPNYGQYPAPNQGQYPTPKQSNGEQTGRLPGGFYDTSSGDCHNCNFKV